MAQDGTAALRVPRLLQVGTDFSGLDTAWVALQRLSLPSKLMFCSDKHPACKRFLQAKHKPVKFFDDVEARQPEQEVYCDIYVTTPPCQSFSTAGKQKGVGDKRGTLVRQSVHYIKRRKPRLVVLENVKGLTQKKFRPVLTGLKVALQNLNYRVFMKILDAKDFKVPQRRRRLFLVAIRKDSLKRKFTWPQPTGTCTLESVLDAWKPADCAGRLPMGQRAKALAKKAFAKIHAKGVNPLKTACAVDIGCSEKFLSHGIDIAPTLLRSRAGSGGFWLSSRGRKMTLTELAKISGFRPAELQGYTAAGVSHCQLAQMFGNSVPVPLMGAVLTSGMLAAGLVTSPPAFPAP